ncbi:hypothetical [Yersinia pestis KIM10+]|uniref:Uncharacterized protein n=1 Tax=Yersinia pestis TaxID=632 RepID=Q8CLG3_YERPE|nr:hypothetical [Yersinia pestis KIM10+]
MGPSDPNVLSIFYRWCFIFSQILWLENTHTDNSTVFTIDKELLLQLTFDFKA